MHQVTYLDGLLEEQYSNQHSCISASISCSNSIGEWQDGLPSKILDACEVERLVSACWNQVNALCLSLHHKLASPRLCIQKGPSDTIDLDAGPSLFKA